MKYLVVSDNHGDRECLVELVERYSGKVDGMFHCGDSELEPTDTLWRDFLVVTGNCDFDPRYKKEQVVTIGSDTIYMAHGHLLHVNQSLSPLLYRSKECLANLAFYGHTHKLGAELVQGTLILNPGSISEPRGQYPYKTYAIVESTETSYTIEFYDEYHQNLTELSCFFNKV